MMIHPSTGEPRKRSAGYWRSLLQRQITEALVLWYWDVEHNNNADTVKVDVTLRKNLRRPSLNRPILIHSTTQLDRADQFLEFLHIARDNYGDDNAFLYIEGEVSEVGGREDLVFDEAPIMAAVANIVSFFQRPNDPNIFRLRMARSGNVFRRVSAPEEEFAEVSPQPAGTNGTRTEREYQEGHLTAWKLNPDEPHKEYGWIEDLDGEKFNAYWRAFANAEDLESVRDFALDNRPFDSDWVELDLAVRFEVGPPQRYGQHPRAVEIALDGNVHDTDEVHDGEEVHDDEETADLE